MEHPTETSPSGSSAAAVVKRVASHLDVDEADLPALYDSVDPDALEALFATRVDGSRRGSGRVTFEYAGCQVIVSSDGTVHVD